MKILSPDCLHDRIQSRMETDLAEGHISGACVRVIQNRQVVLENAYGVTAPGGKTPLQKDAVFRIASMTKTVTAFAICMLSEKGLLSIDDTVDKYYPSFSTTQAGVFDEQGNLAGTKPISVKPTIYHILTHTSGIGSGNCEKYMWSISKDCMSDLSSTVQQILKIPLSFEPYSREQYSGFASFDVLADIVQKVTDMDYNDYLRKEIFGPCNMSDTTFVPNEEQKNRMIVMHDRRNGNSCIGNTFEGCVFENFPTSHYLGGAGLVSTVQDYSAFAQMLMNDGRIDGRPYFPSAAVRLMYTRTLPKSFCNGSYVNGLGMYVVVGKNCNLPVGSYEMSGAYGTHFWNDPINQITAVYMKNSKYDGGGEAETSRNFEADIYQSFHVSSLF